MKTQRIGLFRVEQHLLKQDIDTISKFQFSDIYDEFVCGGNLKSCILWNESGQVKDNALVTYDNPAQKTQYGIQLPYINELITRHFNTKQLRFARVLMLTPGSVFMPHRDYLELKRDLLRFHLPLKTDENCFNSEESTVYHMNVGEVWYINASKIHSAASFSNQNRMHLVLDFEYTDVLGDILLAVYDKKPSIPVESILQRKKVSQQDINNIYALHSLVDSHNFFDIFAIVIKQYFKSAITAVKVYEWLKEVALRSDNSKIIEKVYYWEAHCLRTR